VEAVGTRRHEIGTETGPLGGYRGHIGRPKASRLTDRGGRTTRTPLWVGGG